MPMIPSDLTHICLTEACYLPFDQFELFISKLCPRVEMLRINILDDKNYLDAERWQCLIVQHMGHLRTFDFQHRCVIASDDYQYNTYHAIIDRFSSPFWLEHQWYFAHQHSGCSKHRYGRFYSIQPYRNKLVCTANSYLNAGYS
ncbi:unnamed protein product [Rotaria sp. Silwood1]|nr:unnamed protein product [Rotaria sp. Silwood1]CAF3836658.1 unnamed protein product [Rotaria sp. Silwood1]CAF4572515.1 unnamed protein product [Rotaria sp. Silwood1]CAF4890646.1 unnamed protein product [Rotaria sp. Silwood1]CAF4993075.1 unnamed protein product [Rotaria sp. Silwood1]